MRHLLYLLFCTLLAGCGTQRELPVVERVTRDTLYLHQVQYDSVFVSQERYVDRLRDTLYVQERSVEYRYRLQRDTLRIHQVDSVPVIQEVEVVREVARTPWYAKLLAAVGLVGIFLFIFKIRKSCR